MKSNFAICGIALAAAIAIAVLTGCSKEAPTAAPAAAASAPGVTDRAPAPAMPSVFTLPDVRPKAEAAENALQAMLSAAQATEPNPEKLAVLVNEFLAKRTAMLNSIQDRNQRHSAFREIMQRNMSTPETRKAYSTAMSAASKANASVQVAPQPSAEVAPAVKK